MKPAKFGVRRARRRFRFFGFLKACQSKAASRYACCLDPNPFFSNLLIVCILVVTFPIDSARATTIVVARTTSEIVIGADSKVTDAYGNDLNKRACKIRQRGDLFIAIEGLELDRQTGFSVPVILNKAFALTTSAPAAEKVSMLMEFIVSGLLSELSHLKTHERKPISGRSKAASCFCESSWRALKRDGRWFLSEVSERCNTIPGRLAWP